MGVHVPLGGWQPKIRIITSEQLRRGYLVMRNDQIERRDWTVVERLRDRFVVLEPDECLPPVTVD